MTEEVMSDDELRQLERELGFGDQISADGHDEELETLERELLSMQATVAEESSQASKRRYFHSGQLTIPEEELHSVQCCFGACIDEELENVIPQLKVSLSAAQGEDEVMNFFLLLDKKSAFLYRFRSALAEKAGSGELKPEKYLANLESCIKKNKTALTLAERQPAGEQHVERIRRRLKLLTEELAAANPELQSREQVVDELPCPPHQTHPAQTDHHSVQEVRKVQPSSAALHLAIKIARLITFSDYLRKHFLKARGKEALAVTAKVEKMKAELKKIKSGKVRTIEELDKDFPDLTPEDIVGQPLDERNKAIKETIVSVEAEIDNVKEKKLKAIYTSHYTEVLKLLRQVADSEYGIPPKLVRKSVAFPFPASNPHIPPGQLHVHPVRVCPPNAQYYLSFELQYDEAAWRFESSYSDAKGVFDYTKVIDFGYCLPRRIHKQVLSVVLYRKKLLFMSKVAGMATLPLANLAKFCEFKSSVVFNASSEQPLTVDVLIMVQKPLGKSHKQVDLLCIAECYPTLTLQHSQNLFHIGWQESIQSTRAPSTAKPEEELLAATGQQLSGVDELGRCEFKYPLIPADLKEKLQSSIRKNALDERFCRFEDDLLCVTFLEEFVGELEKQIALLNCNGDFKTSKNGQRLLISAQTKLNSVCASVESGKTSSGDYLRYLETQAEEERKLISFYQKVNVKQGIKFLESRLQAVQEEIRRLKSSQ